MSYWRQVLANSAVLAAALSWGAPECRASAFYYEAQLGLGSIRGGDPYFPGAPSVANYGFAGNLSLAYSFTGGEIPMEFQVGIQQRYSTGTNGDASESYAIAPSYPFVRLQLSRLYVGAGVTPFIWKRTGASASFDGIQLTSGSLAYLGEAGFLWAVTPQFSLGAAAAAQLVTTAGVLSPKPILEGSLVLRFYFGFSSKGASKSSSNEFNGWRYPFGRELL